MYYFSAELNFQFNWIISQFAIGGCFHLAILTSRAKPSRFTGNPACNPGWASCSARLAELNLQFNSEHSAICNCAY